MCPGRPRSEGLVAGSASARIVAARSWIETPVVQPWPSRSAVTVKGDNDAAIELDGDNELKSGGYHAGLEKNELESKGTLTIKDDKGKDGSLIAEGGFGGAGIGGGIESTGSSITIRGGAVEAVGGSNAAGIGDGAYTPTSVTS